MITKEEFEKAVKCCASYISDCDSCPLCASDKHRMCSAYLANNTKNEPVPTADVQEVKHGDWLKPGNDPIDNKQWICSECKGLTETAYYCGHCYYNYCPNCGTRMDGDSL